MKVHVILALTAEEVATITPGESLLAVHHPDGTADLTLKNAAQFFDFAKGQALHIGGQLLGSGLARIKQLEADVQAHATTAEQAAQQNDRMQAEITRLKSLIPGGGTQS